MSFPNPRRPPLRYENSNQSLTGLERTIPPFTPSPKLSVGSAKSDLNKPLPPSPIRHGRRRTSSVYSETQEEIINSYFDRETEPEEDLLPARVFMPPSANQNSNSLAPPKLELLAANIYGGPIMFTASDSMLPQREGQDFNPKSPRTFQQGYPAYGPPTRNSTPASPLISSPLKEMKNGTSAWERKPWERSTDLAEQYRGTLPARSLTPPNFTRLQFQNDFVSTSAPTSSRIIDLDSPGPTASPLSSEPYPRAISPFSVSDDSSAGNEKPRRVSLLRTYANKAMHRHDPSNEEHERERVMSIASQKYPGMSNNSPTKGPRRPSLQARVGDLYDTLTSITISPIRKPSNPAKRGISRERRSPAIRLTAYQKMGTKAWETPPSPKAPKTPRKIRFVKRANPPTSPKTPTSPQTPKTPRTPQSSKSPESQASPTSTKSFKSPKAGLSWFTNRRQRADEERLNLRREDLKKKIVVVGPMNHHSLMEQGYGVGQADGEWL